MRSRLTRSPLSRRLIGSAFVVGLAATLGGCLGYDGEVQHGYVVDAQTLAQVKPGMSKENTLKVMCTPSTTSTVGGDAWYYISQKTEAKLQFMKPQVVDQRVVAIYFKGSNVERIANYGLEDGRVVDMVSRATPTGGQESAFIKNLFRNLLKFS